VIVIVSPKEVLLCNLEFTILDVDLSKVLPSLPRDTRLESSFLLKRPDDLLRFEFVRDWLGFMGAGLSIRFARLDNLLLGFMLMVVIVVISWFLVLILVGLRGSNGLYSKGFGSFFVTIRLIDLGRLVNFILGPTGLGD
jgi:hypothetical protein